MLFVKTLLTKVSNWPDIAHSTRSDKIIVLEDASLKCYHLIETRKHPSFLMAVPAFSLSSDSAFPRLPESLERLALPPSLGYNMMEPSTCECECGPTWGGLAFGAFIV